MKTLFLDCSMGAAGDMLSAALLELFPNKNEIISRLNSLNIPNVVFKCEDSFKCGIKGTRMVVEINGEEEFHSHHSEDDHHSRHHHGDENHSHMHHHGRGIQDIEKIVNNLEITDKIKKDISAIYNIIASAESEVHGAPLTEIHFHEVGAMDAIADITAFSLLLNELAPDKIICSAINTGSGTVKCAHGILPVPAPATALILKGIPIYCNGIKSELCTPTGAALIKYFADDFGEMPVLNVSKIGCGLGAKDFETANCLRAFLGETAENSNETVFELSCNVDDMTAEEISYACDCFYSGGALDVYTTAISMKKSRLGTKISVLCKENDEDKMAALIFKHTSTIGVRKCRFNRYALKRESVVENTPFGEISKKISSGFGVEKEKYEYNDIAAAAAKNNISFRDCLNEIKKKQ